MHPPFPVAKKPSIVPRPEALEVASKQQTAAIGVSKKGPAATRESQVSCGGAVNKWHLINTVS